MAPASIVPPALPPSVEEAYRRKCIQLKQRTTEVEESNDAARLRLSRLKRQVEKMRLERAFLLEQLAKRTSANVEDSEGSPSPPPTPKEKPLRIKRGHRKPSLLPNLESTPGAAGSTFISQHPAGLSPTSEAFSSQAHGENGSARANGAAGKAPPKKPRNAFELYCADVRPRLMKARQQGKDDEASGKEDEEDSERREEGEGKAAVSIKEELESGWKELSEEERDEFHRQQEQQLAEYQKEKDAYDAAVSARKARASADKGDAANGEDGDEMVRADDKHSSAAAAADVTSAADTPPRREGGQRHRTEDEDVEMTAYDTDQETQGDKPDE